MCVGSWQVSSKLSFLFSLLALFKRPKTITKSTLLLYQINIKSLLSIQREGIIGSNAYAGKENVDF